MLFDPSSTLAMTDPMNPIARLIASEPFPHGLPAGPMDMRDIEAGEIALKNHLAALLKARAPVARRTRWWRYPSKRSSDEKVLLARLAILRRELQTVLTNDLVNALRRPGDRLLVAAAQMPTNTVIARKLCAAKGLKLDIRIGRGGMHHCVAVLPLP